MLKLNKSYKVEKRRIYRNEEVIGANFHSRLTSSKLHAITDEEGSEGVANSSQLKFLSKGSSDELLTGVSVFGLPCPGDNLESNSERRRMGEIEANDSVSKDKVTDKFVMGMKNMNYMGNDRLRSGMKDV